MQKHALYMRTSVAASLPAQSAKQCFNAIVFQIESKTVANQKYI